MGERRVHTAQKAQETVLRGGLIFKPLSFRGKPGLCSQRLSTTKEGALSIRGPLPEDTCTKFRREKPNAPGQPAQPLPPGGHV